MDLQQNGLLVDWLDLQNTSPRLRRLKFRGAHCEPLRLSILVAVVGYADLTFARMVPLRSDSSDQNTLK
jgi:hypothetical protein